MGKYAPVNQEAAGLVASESLAAESYEESGEFEQNRNAQPEGVSSSGQGREVGGRQEASGRQANSAVADQYIKVTKGPHGKKVKEGISDDKADVKNNDGLQRALRAEPGSEDDPSRLAERQMLQGQSLGGGGGAGPRQGEVTGETRYGVLEREVDS